MEKTAAEQRNNARMFGSPEAFRPYIADQSAFGAAQCIKLGEPIQLLHNQHQQQLSAADLRTFYHERAAFAELCICLEQQLLFFVEF